jgi:hypothetical protein
MKVGNMSVKSDLLKEIERKANKIKSKRISSTTNNSPETIVFEFFRNVEDARKLCNNVEYDPTIFSSALASLIKRIRSIDSKATCDVRFQNNTFPWNQDFVRGITINWSPLHVQQFQVEQTLYIDVSQMLFL